MGGLDVVDVDIKGGADVQRRVVGGQVVVGIVELQLRQIYLK